MLYTIPTWIYTSCTRSNSSYTHWCLGTWILHQKALAMPPRGPQNTQYLALYLVFFFFLCMCDGVWKKIRSRKEGNHILLMMSFSTTQQDINDWLKSSSKELSIYFLLVVSLQNTERLEMSTKRRITAVRFDSSLHWRLNRNHTDTHTKITKTKLTARI